VEHRPDTNTAILWKIGLLRGGHVREKEGKRRELRRWIWLMYFLCKDDYRMLKPEADAVERQENKQTNKKLVSLPNYLVELRQSFCLNTNTRTRCWKSNTRSTKTEILLFLNLEFFLCICLSCSLFCLSTTSLCWFPWFSIFFFLFFFIFSFFVLLVLLL
jgi:hypothetical protein